ncbi:MAG TPA: integrin alpha, partial [Myxococcota bacterium]|nr:integrin alpha [Myxococcota bacterium]
PDEEEVCGDGADNDCDGTPNECRPEDNLVTGASLLTDGAGYTGTYASAAGDVDGDGLGDILVSSVAYDGGGMIWLVTGGVQADITLETGATLQIQGSTRGNSFSQGSVGDINIDGTVDLPIFSDDSDSDYLGSISFVSASERGARQLSEVAHTRISGAAPYDYAGEHFDWGDVTGDGVLDILVGAPLHVDSEFYYSGAAYLIPGPLAGDHTVAEATITFSGPDGQDQEVGRQTALRDLNGDGHMDAMIGYSDPHENLNKEGALAIFYGPLTGDYSIFDADDVLLGSDYFEKVGDSLHGTEDVDGDGLVDLWIGSEGELGTNNGASYFLRSPFRGGIIRDVATATLTGEAAGDSFGGGMALGDVDQDGTTDVWAGAPGQSQAGEGSGKAYLFYGPFAGTRSGVDADAFHLGSGTDVNGGTGLAILGDVNADGEVDLLFGEGNYNNKGRSVVIFGYSY